MIVETGVSYLCVWGGGEGVERNVPCESKVVLLRGACPMYGRTRLIGAFPA